MSDTRSQATSASRPKLWAVYVNTMDDLIAAPSEKAACDAAAYFRSRVRDGGFTAIEWPYSAEGHAQQLKDWPKHYPPAADWCPHGRPPHESCDDCAETDAEERAL